jgi:hypothetical protein
MKINNSNIYARTAQYISKSKTLQYVIKKTDSNPALVSGVLAFAVGTTLKPATIVAIPNNKEDGKYAIARSISTAIADVGLAFAIFYPLNKYIDKSGRRLFNSKNTIYHNNPDICTKYKSLFNRCFKILFIPFFAWSKFALIDPIVKKMAKRGKNDR